MKIQSLFPVYQPIVDVRDGNIFAFEANLKATLESGEEIGYELLRETGVVENLDFRARDLASTEFKLKKYKLFVNVAPEELHNPLFSEDIELNNVVLEITEETKESVLTDANRLKKKLEKLRENGLEIALDDFGTQLQNYDRLAEYKPDYVKLNKSIVMNVEMLKMFVPLIPQYNVIVEGVETDAQLQSCIELGFHYVQGFYLAKPLNYTKLMTNLLNEEVQNNIVQKLDIQLQETLK